MATELWLLVTAILFTGVGVWMGKKDTIETTIDVLIEKGYLRTKRKNGELEIIKWNDLGE